MRPFLALTVIINIFYIYVSHAAVYTFDPKRGKVSFSAKGRPSLISITGTGEGPKGRLEETAQSLNGELAVRLDTLSTAVDLRDEHMKTKYLEVGRYPEAVIKLDKLPLPKGDQPFTFSGRVRIHGVEQTVTIQARVSGSNSARALNAEFKIKLSDFKIEIPSFKGVTVAEDVTVQVEAPVAVEP